MTATLPIFTPLPSDFVFIYANNGSVSLGPYQGVAQLSEITKFQQWQGVSIPVFANNFVLWNQAIIPISDPTTMVAQVQASLVAGLTSLKQQYLAAYPITTITTI